MTDERAFQDALETALVEAVGAERVEREVRLPSGRVCDFVVDVPVVDVALAIEVEFNPDAGAVASDVIHGVGQATLYAAEIPAAVPVVVTNEAVGDEEEFAALRERMPVVEWSP